MTTPASLLTSAREALTDPRRWTKGHMALDKRGYSVYAADPTAVCWCLMGALEVPAIGWSEAHQEAYITLVKMLGMGVSEFNDHPNTTHQMVLDVLDQAIQASQEPR